MTKLMESPMTKLSLILLSATVLSVAATESAAQTPRPAGQTTESTTPAANSSQSSGVGARSGATATAAPVPTAESVMANNDLNKDGIITKAEATSSGARLILQWDVYDLNKDDKVDKVELAKGLAVTRAAIAASPPVGDSPPTASPARAPAAVSVPSDKPATGTPGKASTTTSPTNKN
jgi:hypothetical protein